MNLLIDSAAEAGISHFATKFGGSQVLVDGGGLRASIPLGLFSLSFSQPERYERYVSCSLDFEDDCSFAFDAVRAAIGKNKDELIEAIPIPIGGDEAEFRRSNSKYVKCALSFFESHMTEFKVFPPQWFLDACEMEKQRMLDKFPEIALSEFRKKMALWNKWNAITVSESLMG